MKNNRSISVAVGLALLATPVFSHEDDLGDVYPEVRVEGKQFAVYFRNNDQKNGFKTVITTAGKVVSERKAVEEVPEIYGFLDSAVAYEKDAAYKVPSSLEGKPWVTRTTGKDR